MQGAGCRMKGVGCKVWGAGCCLCEALLLLAKFDGRHRVVQYLRKNRWFSRFGQFTRIGNIPGGRRPLLQEGGPIGYQPRPSRCSKFDGRHRVVQYLREPPQS